MNKETETLKGKVAQKLFQFRFTISNKTIDAEWEFQSPKQPYLEEAAQILSICKESGLMFTETRTGIDTPFGQKLKWEHVAIIKEIDNEPYR